ncbi:sugar transferase [Tenacibaculum aiptasiae]|uniref:sugar transferase n=1 Tax=Tenacibaculum aiptasiae TaxID=426481 RepID=UPI00232EFB56|nr:sugar transferase [Tenacibaculum aiptasiae]
MYKNFFKRLIDFIVAFLGLFILSPIILLLTICLFFANKGKPFFYQIRPGKNEQPFKIIKFKTMTDEKDEKGNLLPDAKRLTKIGRFVRKTSLDELLQLINVLKGDMSLIGPRPLLLRYLPYYTRQEKLRHTVRPGITGLAQVSGRNLLSWEKRIQFDLDYVKEISFLTDCKILILTMKSVLLSKNIVVNPGSQLEDLDEQRKKQENI